MTDTHPNSRPARYAPRPATATPRGSFVDELNLKHGPRAELGRFFLQAEQQLWQAGVTMRFATFDQLVDLNTQHFDSWYKLTHILDPRDNPAKPGEATCLIGYDANDQPMTSIAVRNLDLTNTTFKEEVESLRFFFGSSAGQMHGKHAARLTAPSAATQNEKAVYTGAYWLRPDFRQQSLSTIIPRIGRYYALTQWNADREISFGRRAFLDKRLSDAYGFVNVEPAMNYWIDGALVWDHVLVSTSRADMLSELSILVAGSIPTPSAISMHDSGRKNDALTGT